MTKTPDRDRETTAKTPESASQSDRADRLQVAASSLDIFATGGAPPPAPAAPAPAPQRPDDQGPIGADFFATGGGPTPAPTAAASNTTPPVQAWQPEGHLAAGRYKIIAEIGRGGMGRVYKAIDQRNDTTIAIKCLEAHLIGTEWSQQWLQELQLHQRLKHPNIAPMRELEKDEQMGFFLTMDFIDGYDVEQALLARKAKGRKTPFLNKNALKLLKEIAAALDHAHDAGVVHLDIKPSNVLLQGPPKIEHLRDPNRVTFLSFERARLIDFGIARLRADNAGGQIIGTVYYMPPEQLNGSGPLTPAADVYALGVMAYQLFTGQIFQGGMPGPSALNDSLSVAVDAVHEKAVAFRPEDRFQRAGAFVEALEQSISARVQKAQRLGETVVEKVVTKTVVKQEKGINTVVQMPTIDKPTRSEQRWPQIKEKLAQKRPGWLETPYARKAPKVLPAAELMSASPGLFASWAVEPQPESLVLLDRSDHPMLELSPIPTGTFTMGTHAKDRSARRPDKPQQQVDMSGFYMARTPITNRMWHIFLEESRYKQPSDAQHPDYLKDWDQLEQKSHKPEHPLQYISMLDAWAFCDFYGVSLPSEAQWEYSLRGTDGRTYPWGEDVPTPKDPSTMVAQIAQPRQETMPVAHRVDGASPFGILDGIGPVYQWVADEYDARWLRQVQRKADPVCLGKRREGFYSLRGANATTAPEQAQLYRRHSASPDTCRDDIGFRVCLDMIPS